MALNARMALLNECSAQEQWKGGYDLDEGIYPVVINDVCLKTNKNGNSFIEFVCSRLDKTTPHTAYCIYYLCDNAELYSISSLRSLLFDYGKADFTKEEITNDDLIVKKLLDLVDEESFLQVKDVDGYKSTRLFKAIPNGE